VVDRAGLVDWSVPIVNLHAFCSSAAVSLQPVSTTDRSRPVGGGETNRVAAAGGHGDGTARALSLGLG